MNDFQAWIEGIPQWLRDWGTLVGTFMLLGVTGWYALLTHRLARSSEEASAAAKDAAEAAKSSAAIAAAGTDVNFLVEVRDDMFSESPVIILRGGGATVYVHRVELRSGHYHASADLSRSGTLKSVSEVDLERLAESATLPARLYRDDEIWFASPVKDEPPHGPWDSVLLRVTYSFDGLVVAGTRHVS